MRLGAVEHGGHLRQRLLGGGGGHKDARPDEAHLGAQARGVDLGDGDLVEALAGGAAVAGIAVEVDRGARLAGDPLDEQ